MTGAVEPFAEHRSLLVGVAYRVLGTMSDAEDVVQDAWLRWAGRDRAEVVEPRAYLVTITTRLAIDRLRRRQASREQYVGEWLPEPVVTEAGPSERAELAESVSMGLLLVLETLSPLERAVFVLHDAFGFGFAQIAEMLDRSEVAVRQLATRARKHVHERRPRFASDERTQRVVTERFLAAASEGDVAALIEVLAPGVTLMADSGGKVRAPLLPVTGADKVARFFLAVAGRVEYDQVVRPTTLNGQPALVVSDSRGNVIAAAVLEVSVNQVQRIFLVGNPEKLRGIGAAPVP